jgi:hypothetical protein
MGDLLKRVFSLDVRSIALMRIAAAAILLWDTCDRMRHLADHYFSDSAIPFEIVEEYYKFFPTWSLHLLSDSNTYQTSLFILQAIAACFLLVGYHASHHYSLAETCYYAHYCSSSLSCLAPNASQYIANSKLQRAASTRSPPLHYCYNSSSCIPSQVS